MTKMFVNLPVADLDRSMAFFKGLGFTFNPQFTDETAACMVISEHNYAMLLTKQKFSEFISQPVSDATQATEVLIALSADSRQAVDAMADKALSTGGGTVRDPQDYGFMYTRAFADPDGHIWEPFWMDEAQVQPEPPAAA